MLTVVLYWYNGELMFGMRMEMIRKKLYVCCEFHVIRFSFVSCCLQAGNFEGCTVINSSVYDIRGRKLPNCAEGEKLQMSTDLYTTSKLNTIRASGIYVFCVGLRKNSDYFPIRIN